MGTKSLSSRIPVLAFVLLMVQAAVCHAGGTSPASEKPQGGTQSIYVFWTKTCPHCAKARAFLDTLSKNSPGLVVRSFELSDDGRHEPAFATLSKHFAIHPPAVPLILIGDGVVVGYDEDLTTGREIQKRIEDCQKRTCRDIAGEIIRNVSRGETSASKTDGPSAEVETRGPSIPATIRLPLFGDLETRSLSLPVLTIVLGAVDGFNPCAMWVLVFLIGLLVGVHDSFRMWSYGAIFLLTSAAVYFAFMAAWLNFFLFLGSLSWVRAIIGLFAIGAAAYYLWQFKANPDAACPVAPPGERQRVMTRLKELINERSFMVAAFGLVVLAATVNLIELLCSAGIPAIYTQVLALSDLSSLGYYAHLGLYITVFLLDDVIVFVTAMITLRSAGLTAQYARYSHLIGGIVLGVIGILLLFRPEWLILA